MIPLFPNSFLLRLKSAMPLQSSGYMADWFFNIVGHFHIFPPNARRKNDLGELQQSERLNREAEKQR